MQRLNYPLRHYTKAIEQMALKKGLSHVKWKETKGSIVRFELFEQNASEPSEMWTIHHSHTRKQEVWSKEDYRKAARCLNCTLEELIKIIESL